MQASAGEWERKRATHATAARICQNMITSQAMACAASFSAAKISHTKIEGGVLAQQAMALSGKLDYLSSRLRNIRIRPMDPMKRKAAS